MNPTSTPQTVDGKYVLLRELGSGGAGSVFEAEHLIVGKRVAIKLMHPELARDPDLQARFVAEARAAARIGHANVVDIFDLGVSREGVSYMVMELLEGETLLDIVESRGALAPSYACELTIQVLAGLSAAHAHGIVHRDLKPANIIVTHPRPERPLVKVLDFGIATGVVQGTREDGLIFGTPMYMAPEQALGRTVDARADVYSAGAILYELLSGRTPFAGDTPGEVLNQAVQGCVIPLREVAPHLPPRLVAVVEAAMAYDVGARTQSASELAAQLLCFVADGDAMSVEPMMGLSAPPIPLIATARGAQALPGVPGRVVISSRDFPSLDLVRRGLAKPARDSLLADPEIPKPPASPQLLVDSSLAPQRLPLAPEELAERRATTEVTQLHRPWFGARAVAMATAAGFSVGMVVAWAAGLL